MAEYGADSIKVLEGLEPTRKRPNQPVFVQDNDMSDVIKYRAKIREMDFTPLTDEELAEKTKRNEFSIINNRLAGIYFTNAEEAFFTMVLEERVPDDISEKIIDELVMSKIK